MPETVRYPDPEDLDFEALLDAYDELLHDVVTRGIRFARYHDSTRDPDRRDVWMPAGRMVDIEKFVQQQTGVEIDIQQYGTYDGTLRLVAVLNALDRDVGRVLEGGHREEIEELYLGLRELERK